MPKNASYYRNIWYPKLKARRAKERAAKALGVEKQDYDEFMKTHYIIGGEAVARQGAPTESAEEPTRPATWADEYLRTEGNDLNTLETMLTHMTKDEIIAKFPDEGLNAVAHSKKQMLSIVLQSLEKQGYRRPVKQQEPASTSGMVRAERLDRQRNSTINSVVRTMASKPITSDAAFRHKQNFFLGIIREWNEKNPGYEIPYTLSATEFSVAGHVYRTPGK